MEAAGKGLSVGGVEGNLPLAPRLNVSEMSTVPTQTRPALVPPHKGHTKVREEMAHVGATDNYRLNPRMSTSLDLQWKLPRAPVCASSHVPYEVLK